MRSNSSTRVSATSTKTFARRSADTVLMPASWPALRWSRSCSWPIQVEAQPPGDDVRGHIVETAFFGAGVRADPHQRLSDGDTQLNHDHPLRLEQLSPGLD